ncbi:hypothetical protein Ancab_015367 [Ancistrocladus abbreviatus]
MPEPDVQTKPLAPSASLRRRSNEDEAISGKQHRRFKHRKCVKCYGCVTAVILVLFVIILVLALTVFRAKDPTIRLNSVTIKRLDISAGILTAPKLNMTLVADVSIKNPNAVTFKYNNSTSAIYYDGRVFSEVQAPPGQARARRTVRMNLTVDVMIEKLLGSSSLIRDISSGSLSMYYYTRVAGRVKIINVVKKHIVVKLNCSVIVSITNRQVDVQHCRHHVSL